MQTRRLSRLLPLFAIATGAALVAVTSAFKEQPKTKSGDTLYTFYYNGPNYTTAAIENESNWVYTSSSDLCSFDPEKACRIQVTEDYVNNPGTMSATLKSSANVTATENSEHPGTSYVSSIADGDGVISNQAY